MKTPTPLLCFFALLCLASCASSDSTYQSLLLKADKAPTPDAIVGMWHRKQAFGLGGESSSTLLCRSDGSVFRDVLASDALSHTDETDTTGKWTWHYSGGGVWHPKLHGVHYGEKWLLADDHLLVSGHTDALGLARYSQVFERSR